MGSPQASFDSPPPQAVSQELLARCRDDLQRQGYAVVPGLLAPEAQEELRQEADTLYEIAQEQQHIGASTAADDVASSSSSGGARWGADAAASCIYETLPGPCCTPQLRRSYAAYAAQRGRWPLRPASWRLLFRSGLTALMLGLLGPRAVLFNDQYILKPPRAAPGPSTAFGWHRDSDWCADGAATRHAYLSVWCALDDMTSGNGCFVVQPGSHLTAAADADADADEQPQANAAVSLEVPAGTAILTSDTVLHCSGPNRSRHMRRAWMPQFAAGPITWRDGGGCVALAVPLRPPLPGSGRGC